MEDSSDDEAPYMPTLRLHAVTEALLAALDPTATATQDGTRAVDRRRRRDPGRPPRGLRGCCAGEKHGAGGSVTPLVGGDSVALGPGFAAMARPPRRPQRRVEFDVSQEDVSQKERLEEEQEEGEIEEPRLGQYARHAQGDDGKDYRHKRVHRQKNEAQSARELGHLSTHAVERPMRRVVISPRRTGSPLKTTSPPSPVQLQAPRATNVSQPPAPAAAATRHRRIVIGGISYRILRRLGRGGSGRVYEVMAPDTRTWAFKAITLSTLDDTAKQQVENEVALLQSLRGTERVVALEDWCIDEAKNAIHIVMELGQIDLEHIIKDHLEREGSRLDPVFVGYYWREMLRCVAALHAHGIVHADIKPANFVSVDGVLKMVDFGIAHDLPDDTAHLYLENLGGTPNYMAPETLRILSRGGGAGGSRVVRFGTPCDLWSLGCVLHRMVYGQPPFAHFRGLAPKLLAIAGDEVAVEVARDGLGGVRVPDGLQRTMRACLDRDPGRRPTAARLLAGSADGLLGERQAGVRERDVGRVVGDVMESMATRMVRREVLDEWLAEAMEEVGLK